MTLRTIVWKEIRERPAAIAMCVATIVVGVAALVAMREVTLASESQVSRRLADLGANILVLPKNASLDDYYAADMSDNTLPEEYATQILLANLTGVEELAPKLCVTAQLGERQVALTGILPQSEFEAAAAWRSVGFFTEETPTGCGAAGCVQKPSDPSPEALATRRTILELSPDQALLGADVARATGIAAGDKVELLGKSFTVLAVLPPTGSIDDGRVFAHLHEVQRLAGTGEVVNVIEVLACCQDGAEGLVSQLGDLLRDTRIVTITQLVSTQVGVNRLMSRLAVVALAAFVLVGGIGVASMVWTNVRERRREIGTMLALGATPRLIAGLFLMKATCLGLGGGFCGAVLGALLALWLGPYCAGVAVQPSAWLIFSACGAATALSLAAAYWPARAAARLDPCACFRET